MSVKVVVLNEFCDLSELMAVRDTSKYPCIPFRSIPIRTNMPKSMVKSKKSVLDLAGVNSAPAL